MNKTGLLLAQLHDAETGLAAEYRAVAGRQAAEHDLYYLGHTLAAQCDQHAEAVRTIAGHFGTDLSGQSSPQPVHDMMAGIDPGPKIEPLAGRRQLPAARSVVGSSGAGPVSWLW